VVETQPGDVVVFHAHLFNCAQGRTPRLSWTIDYLLWLGVGDADRMRLVRDMTLDGVEWTRGAEKSPSRALATGRLELLAVISGD
jgi:hypothetical protein